MKYQGSCHCKAVTFAFEAEEITQGLQCNCSICLRKNAIMTLERIPASDFQLITGKEALQTYLWGDKVVNQYFCRHCGIYPFHEVGDTPHAAQHYRVNLGCVDGVEPRSLERVEFDGRAM